MASILVRVPQRNRINRGLEREMRFKELADISEGTGKSKICRVGWQAGNSNKS